MTESYDEAYARSLADPDGFWGEAAEAIDWSRRWGLCARRLERTVLSLVYRRHAQYLL